jgi:DNA repair exonuclease SbcCD nuclease subunit
VAIHGRSFPERAVDEDLVPSYPPPVPGFFNIGLLHTSLTGRAGHDTYAPTDLATLKTKGYDYWALGHVHAREVLAEQPRIVFPGNLQGRHAKETGPKGCELVTVQAGRVEAECVPLDVVRWNQLTLSLDGTHRLDALGEAFRHALDPLLTGAMDRLHAVRVTLTGSTELHRLEASQPGTLAAAMYGAAQDIGEAEVWIEQVRLDLTTPLDRMQAARRQDAVGELVRLVDSIAGDEPELLRWAQAELGDVLGSLPQEVAAGDVPKLDDPAELKGLLMDAEATVLARLTDPGAQE